MNIEYTDTVPILEFRDRRADPIETTNSDNEDTGPDLKFRDRRTDIVVESLHHEDNVTWCGTVEELSLDLGAECESDITGHDPYNRSR